uniref:Uncharacterized protein n=1 Tax=Tetranychus urticae TaxID=32264 RepID=T1KIR9_TETUR
MKINWSVGKNLDNPEATDYWKWHRIPAKFYYVVYIAA